MSSVARRPLSCESSTDIVSSMDVPCVFLTERSWSGSDVCIVRWRGVLTLWVEDEESYRWWTPREDFRGLGEIRAAVGRAVSVDIGQNSGS